MTSLDIRRGTDADFPAIHHLDHRAFGEQGTPEGDALYERLIPADRYVLGWEGPTLVGQTALVPLTLTVPGGAQVPTAGISAVAVAATHRRRGVLREVFTAQHQQLLDDGYALGALTASEATIYGRFGYGPATAQNRVEIDRRHAEFRTTAPDPGGVRQVEADEARALLPDVHARWQRRTAGAIHRNDLWWEWQLIDRAENRGGASALFFLVHPDGYATYRAADGKARLIELVAATDGARAALWRVLMGLDFADTVTADISSDDPLRHLLTDQRAVRVTGTVDGMWISLLDIPAALAQRRFPVEIDTVLELSDGFLGRAGRFRLRGGPDGAECLRTDDGADVSTDVANLGSLYLGGHRAHVLHRAGLIEGNDDAVHRLDLALRTDRAPEHGTDF